MEKHFKIPLDTLTRRLTVILMVFFMAILPAFLLILAFSAADTSHRSLGIIFAAAIVTLMPIFSLFAPNEYTVDESGITVHRYGPDVIIPAHSIAEVSTISEPTRFAKLGGVSYFLGYYGWFRCKELGSFKAYTGRTRDLVIIKTLAGRTYALSPDDNDPFVLAVKEIAQNVKK